MNYKMNLFVYLAIFFVLVFVYGYIWVLVSVYFYQGSYSIGDLNQDLTISVISSLVSTVGFYLKVRLAKKNL